MKRGPVILAVGTVLAAACGSSTPSPLAPDTMAVLSMTPSPRTVTAAADGAITLRFDRALRRESVVLDRTVHVFGRWSGTLRATLRFDDERTVSLVPSRPFSAGEQVVVLVGSEVSGADGTRLRESGFSAQFWTRARPSAMDYVEVARLSTRRPGAALSRAYGGVASDLDGDGRLDLSIVNEDTWDLSVFMNRPGGFEPIAERAPLGPRASPSESGDFDRDGRTDLAVANIAGGTVSILRGLGNGRFATPQVLPVGATPRGIAALDVDGDADLDLAVACVGADDVAILVNENGTFRVGARVDSGAVGEWALAASDLDEDGVLDLVTGASTGHRLVGLLNRAGVFVPQPGVDAGGSPWQLASGDVDGDGHDDVAVANGRSNTASFARGDGRGGFAPATVLGIDPFGLASDLGDLDGDGDLDWVTSSYDGDWRLHENVGGGTFRLGRELSPRDAASCALMFDVDGDGDLDLGLIDEEADEVIVELAR